MSAAWFNHRVRQNELWNVQSDAPFAFSAGSCPSQTINQVAVQAMGELGIDLTENAFPKPWTMEVAESVGLVISMGRFSVQKRRTFLELTGICNLGCGDQCPKAPGAGKILV
jgi:protein-tyrosine-phosphatase